MDNKNFEFIMSSAEIGYWELDPNTLKINRTLKHDEIFGLPHGTTDWSYEIFLTYVNHEDLYKVKLAFDELYNKNISYDLEFRIIRHDGLERWVWAFGKKYKENASDVYKIIGLVKDVTEENLTKNELEKKLAIAKQFAEHVDFAFYQMSDDCEKINFFSNSIQEIIGKNNKDLYMYTSSWLELIHADDREKAKNFYLNKVDKYVDNQEIEYRIKHEDGKYVDILDRSFFAKDETHNIVGLLGIISDLTGVYAGRLLGSIADDVTNILNTKDIMQNITLGFLRIFCNELSWNLGEVWLLDESRKNLYRIISYDLSISGAAQYKNIKNASDVEANVGIFAEIINSKQIVLKHNYNDLWHGKFSTLVAARIMHNDECFGIINFFIRDLITPSQEITDLLWRSINQFGIYIKKYLSQEQLSFASNYEAITGLLNRQAMVESLKNLISIQHSDSIVLIKILVDNFGKISQGLGYEVKDKLLKSLAEFFVNETHPKLYLICSLENGSFAFVFNDVKNLQDIQNFATRMLKINKHAFMIDSHKIFVTLSIGVSIFPKDSKDLQSLLMNARSALIRAHKSGGNNIVYGYATLQNEMFEQVNLEFAIHRALERNEFIMYYQPKVSLKSGAIVGAEALIRWQDPNGTLHMPSYFLDIAENSDLIVNIGEWVLRDVCKQIVEDGFGVPISVNISIRQFKKRHVFFEFVEKILKEFKVNPAMLEFEITESVIIEGPEIIEDLKKFQEMGIKIAFDDFGTKYCSLNYLKNYIPDRIKIDKSFVDGVPGSTTNIAIIKSIVGLAKELKVLLTVEGAERSEQVRFFIDLGCDELQSFYLSKAVPPIEFKKLFFNNYAKLFATLK